MCKSINSGEKNYLLSKIEYDMYPLSNQLFNEVFNFKEVFNFFSVVFSLLVNKGM